MSEISDHREHFLGMIAEAHGTPQKLGRVVESVLPAGARWIPHQPKTELKPRKNGPASGFFAELCLS